MNCPKCGSEIVRSGSTWNIQEGKWEDYLCCVNVKCELCGVGVRGHEEEVKP